MEKTAVDNAAKDYWATYFKEYGQMWVRDVPRRIKSAVRRREKAASIVGRIAPMAADVADDGTLSIEAAFVGKLDDQDARVLITAQFDAKGRLQNIETTRVT